MDSPILVPPSQSGAAWPACWSAKPGRTCASVPVIRVSRVANVNTSVSAPPAATYSNCSMARAYGSMDPEMSHNTTSRRGSRSGARRARRNGWPPVRRAWRSVLRRSVCRPRWVCCGRRDRRSGTASVSLRMSPESMSNSAGESSAKSVLASRSVALANTSRAASSSPGSPSSSIFAGSSPSLISRRAWTWAARAASRSTSDSGERPCSGRARSGLGGGPYPTGGLPGWVPNIASKTRRSVSMCSLLATSVASAHRYSPDTVTGRATATAPAKRSQRPGSAGTPAARSSAPNRAAIRARSSPSDTRAAPPCPGARPAPPEPGSPSGLGLIGGGQGREPGLPYGLQVFGVLEHRAGRLARVGAVQAGRAEHVQRTGPADRLRDPGRLGEVEVPQPGHPPGDLAGQDLRSGRHPAADDRRDPAGVGVVDPVVEAAPFQRVVQVTGPVRGQHDDRAEPGPPGPQFRDGDRRLGEQLEQERLELVVAAVHLVDQQHGRVRAWMVEGGEQRPGQQILLAEQVSIAQRLAARLGQPDRQQLARVVPLIQRFGGGQALVALQPQHRRVQRLGQCLGRLGLADPRFTLE